MRRRYGPPELLLAERNAAAGAAISRPFSVKVRSARGCNLTLRARVNKETFRFAFPKSHFCAQRLTAESSLQNRHVNGPRHGPRHPAPPAPYLRLGAR
ncbi:hypothetical protein EVAR_40379_1 [Eumeta japonica]|uniref:Uncharacterized protein n=1 Tax=Eumeta variegata TaxID=151549 RepID=A0A4C1XNJ5_EUMVA|nr:hypothetical protein EVAR_40379_1 [Eumeta japonica]